jgi:hypothetical protein
LGDREASGIEQDGVCALAEGKARVVTVEVFQRLSYLVGQILDESQAGHDVGKDQILEPPNINDISYSHVQKN